MAAVFVGEESARREAVRRLDVLAQRVNEREAVLYGELAYDDIDELWCVCVCVCTWRCTYILIYRSTNIHTF